MSIPTPSNALLEDNRPRWSTIDGGSNLHGVLLAHTITVRGRLRLVILVDLTSASPCIFCPTFSAGHGCIVLTRLVVFSLDDSLAVASWDHLHFVSTRIMTQPYLSYHADFVPIQQNLGQLAVAFNRIAGLSSVNFYLPELAYKHFSHIFQDHICRTSQ